MHPKFFRDWFPQLKMKKEKVILADWFLRKYGYQSTMEKIVESQYKNIVIIGGSASGFSCAYLMLKGPAGCAEIPSVELKQIP